MEGTPFGRYRLLELLGAGAMGEVHRAYDTGTDRLVAVKVLAPEFAHNATYRKRFQREAQAAARLAEPHIVPIHDFGEIDGRLFLDMRLVQGPNLATLLAERDRLEPAEAVEVIAQIAAALDAAHAEGLVHRDVKPSNILVTRAGFAYLIDFGIARSDEDTTVTTTGAVIGTFAYMAPERLADDDSGTPSDVYSLACVLYECLVGAKPYRGESMQRQIAAHLNDEPPSPSTAGLPRPFDAVIAKGMAKDPGRRYETAGELAAAARAALWEPPTAPSPVPAIPAPRSDQAASATPGPDPGEPASAAPASAPASAASATPGAASDPATPATTAPAPVGAPGPAGPAAATPAVTTTPAGPTTTRFPRRAAVVLSVLALAVAGTSALALTRDTSTLVTETPVTTAPVTRSATTAPVTSHRPSSPPPQPAPPVSVSESVPVTSIAPEGPVAVPAPPPAWAEPEPQPSPPLPPPTVTATPITTTPPPPITTTTVEPTESETTTPETTTSETTSETTVTTTTDETGEEASGDDSADATGSTIATSSPIGTTDGTITTSPTTRTPAGTTTPGSTSTSPPRGTPQHP